MYCTTMESTQEDCVDISFWFRFRFRFLFKVSLLVCLSLSPLSSSTHSKFAWTCARSMCVWRKEGCHLQSCLAAAVSHAKLTKSWWAWLAPTRAHTYTQRRVGRMQSINITQAGGTLRQLVKLFTQAAYKTYHKPHPPRPSPTPPSCVSKDTEV